VKVGVLPPVGAGENHVAVIKIVDDGGIESLEIIALGD